MNLFSKSWGQVDASLSTAKALEGSRFIVQADENLYTLQVMHWLKNRRLSVNLSTILIVYKTYRLTKQVIRKNEFLIVLK